MSFMEVPDVNWHWAILDDTVIIEVLPIAVELTPDGPLAMLDGPAMLGGGLPPIAVSDSYGAADALSVTAAVETVAIVAADDRSLTIRRCSGDRLYGDSFVITHNQSLITEVIRDAGRAQLILTTDSFDKSHTLIHSKFAADVRTGGVSAAYIRAVRHDGRTLHPRKWRRLKKQLQRNGTGEPFAIAANQPADVS